MESQIIYSVNTVEQLISSVLSIIFCLLVLFVLVYYIRRRYKLYKEIIRIPQELLIKESYRNHLKNLKIMCIINNFIIVILIMEFIQYFSKTFTIILYFLFYLVKVPIINFDSFGEFQKYSSLFYVSMRSLFVPVLSMLMDFLWLAYRKYEYKYTIIRWIWYTVIRALFLFLLPFSLNSNFISLGYHSIYIDLVHLIFGILPIIDFIQFVYYARKFYLHLKSREKEIRLFYFDRKAYLDSKYLRIHFKIATILVGIAFFFSTLSSSVNVFIIPYDLSYYTNISQQLQHIMLIVYENYVDFIDYFFSLISQVLFIFNYLYIFIVVVYKSYRDGQKLKNINDYIKPIMKQYHDNYYNRYTNYT